jgi:hypothetical protein
LSGNFPVGNAPSYAAHPNNLLTLLHPYYDIFVYEVVTNFCVSRLFHCPDAEIASSESELLKDIFYLYMARVLAKNIDLSLPDLSRTWGPFLTPREEIEARMSRFQQFLQSLPRRSNDKALYFFHHMLPHSPYVLTSQGSVYEAPSLYFDPNMAGNRSLLSELQGRYLMQVSYVDKELGQFIAQLKHLGLYEKSLVIITADHGVSWRPEAPGRGLTPANADMILAIPLFIKTPFQQHGEVSTRDVQQIDLAPTISDLFGLRLPWEHTGRSVFEPEVRKRHKIAYSLHGTQFSFPSDLGLISVSVQPDTVRSSLIGEKIETFKLNRYEAITGVLDQLPVSLLHMPPGGDDFPIPVSGWAVSLEEESVPDQIAVAVNGEIVAVTSPCCERPGVVEHLGNVNLLRSGWKTAFPSSHLRSGVNVVTAYAVLDARKRALAILKTTPENKIHVVADIEDDDAKRLPWIGKRIEDLDVRSYESVEGYLDRLSVSQVSVRSSIDELPIVAAGWAVLLDEEKPPEAIAVAIDGMIVAITSPCCDRPDVVRHFGNGQFLRSGWKATFSSRVLKEGENQVAAYVVVDADKGQLALLKVLENTIQVVQK